MANYHWMGPGRVTEAGQIRAEAPKIEEPSAPQVVAQRLHLCTVKNCGRKFTKAMIAARHFNASHGDLHVEKDSWREWIEAVDGP